MQLLSNKSRPDQNQERQPESKIFFGQKPPFRFRASTYGKMKLKEYYSRIWYRFYKNIEHKKNRKSRTKEIYNLSLKFLNLN